MMVVIEWWIGFKITGSGCSLILPCCALALCSWWSRCASVLSHAIDWRCCRCTWRWLLLSWRVTPGALPFQRWLLPVFQRVLLLWLTVVRVWSLVLRVRVCFSWGCVVRFIFPFWVFCGFSGVLQVGFLLFCIWHWLRFQLFGSCQVGVWGCVPCFRPLRVGNGWWRTIFLVARLLFWVFGRWLGCCRARFWLWLFWLRIRWGFFCPALIKLIAELTLSWSSG